MKSFYLSCIIILGLTKLNAQKSVYESNAFETLSETHTTVAILPFYASLTLDEAPANQEELLILEQREGFAVQKALSHYFDKRSKRRQYTVNFQDIEKTNALLKENKVDFSNLNTLTSKELSELLGVDALVSGDISLNTLLSQGVKEEGFSLIDFFTGESDYGRIAIKLSDGNSGKLLWKFEQTISRKSGKDTDAIIETMLRRSTRKFPYDRERVRD